MQQNYTTPGGTPIVASINGNMLTLYVPRGPVDRMVIPPRLKSSLGFAIKRPDFEPFAAVVDQIDGC